MTTPDDKQPSIAERSKAKLTQKAVEYLAVPSIQKAADNPHHPGNNEAKEILSEWKTANNLPEPRCTKKQIQVHERMMKFVRHYPI